MVTPDGPATPERANRRELLGAGLALTGAVAIGGCGSGAHRSSTGRSPAIDDPEVELLNALLDLEHRVITAYSAAIPLLSGRLRDTAKRILSQELSHSGELYGLVHDAGGRPRMARAAYPLGAPRDEHDVLTLLIALEQEELDRMTAAITQLSLGSTRAAIAAVLGSDAQHLTVLREATGLDPLPAVLPGVAG